MSGFTQSLGHAVDGHDLIFAITFPVGSFLDASLDAHLSFLEVFFCGQF